MSRNSHQPLPQSDSLASDFDTASADSGRVSSSLIHSGSGQNERNNGYSTYSDPEFSSGAENPYRDTTESDINLQHIQLEDLVPKPWKSFEQVLIASYISVVFFLFTGLLAIRYARRSKRHQSKGLMGMAQKELKLAVSFIYASLVLGFLFFFIIIPIAATA